VLNTRYLGFKLQLVELSQGHPLFCSYGNSALKTETEMFEKYYNKLELKDQRPPRLSEIKITGAEIAQVCKGDLRIL